MTTPQPQATAAAQIRRGRPFGLIVVCVLELMVAISFIGAAIGIDTPGINGKQFAVLDAYNIVVPVLSVLALAGIAAAVGLWFRQYWAWIITILFAVVALVINLLAYAWGNPSPARLLMYVIMAFYLNQGSLRTYIDSQRSSKP